MLNFLRKPFGYALIIIVHCLIVNQIFNQFFPNQLFTQFTWQMGLWTLVSLYAFLTTLLLYRLLIKQEPFSKEFKKAASKWYAVLAVIQTVLHLVGSKILYLLNPEAAAKLVSPNILGMLNHPNSFVVFVAACLLVVALYPIVYWMNYCYLWLTDKIVNFFLKSKNE